MHFRWEFAVQNYRAGCYIGGVELFWSHGLNFPYVATPVVGINIMVHLVMVKLHHPSNT